jgi:uncharacterized damage-inducible protein DinB
VENAAAIVRMRPLAIFSTAGILRRNTMALSDPFEILLVHNDWANRQILEACRPLSIEQFHRKFEMGPGSLHDTMTHVFEAMLIWTEMLAGRERPTFEKKTRTVDELFALQESSSKAFAAQARAKGVAEPMTATRQGKSWVFPRGGVVTHVMTHGMHHRAQALNMLRHVGAQLPTSSVVEWMRETQATA